MRKLISLVLILAMPAMVFGATGYSVLVGGAAAASYNVGEVPDAMVFDVNLTLDQAGTFGFFGALDGPQGTITSRTYNAVITGSPSKWNFTTNDDAAYLAKPLSALLDFGAIEAGGTGAELPVGTGVLVSLGVNGLASLPVGVYNFSVVSSSDLNAGASWSNTGEPILVDASVPFVLTVKTPEPASMLLLAAALPFLRRRSA
jgi:hypothetical protein